MTGKLASPQAIAEALLCQFPVLSNEEQTVSLAIYQLLAEGVPVSLERLADAKRAKALGIKSVPAVVVDGKLAACCAIRGIDRSVLEAAGIGKPIK